MSILLRRMKKYSFLYGPMAVGCLLLCVTIISLLSFHAHDPSYFYQTSQHVRYHNWLGMIGANYAALLLYCFGRAAFMLLAGIGYGLWFWYTKKEWRHEWDRMLGQGVLFVTGMLAQVTYQVSSYGIGRPGGVVGQWVYGLFFSPFAVFAQKIILFFLAWIGLVLVVRFSFLNQARMLIAGIRYACRKDTVFAQGAHYVGVMCVRFSQGFAWLVHKVYVLLSGQEVRASDQSIVSFERDESVDQDIDGVIQDVFWHDHVPHVKQLHEEPKRTALVKEDAFEQQDQASMQQEITAADVFAEQQEKITSYKVPETSLFHTQGLSKEELQQRKDSFQSQAHILEQKLEQFGVQGEVTAIHPGPVVTLFEYRPESHIKLSKILALEDDLAMALQALSIRIIAPIPGKSVVGFEVANKDRQSVYLSNILKSKSFQDFVGELPLVLGEDTLGNHIIVDLAKMPHLLVAGSTGSGKSVALNAMLVTLLCSMTPDQLRLVIIDPKRLEFASYEDIAHLLFPIVTDTKKAVPVLRWVVDTMESRYALMAEYGVRNIFDYHELCQKDKDLEDMPFIAVIIDELADLMMTAGKEVEDLIARLAQMARAAGIHMIVATQRPSVDVITGVIKVNFPNRVSFKVTSKVDSRTILDSVGAEKLLGRGDMLFLDASMSHVTRVHGAYVSNKEIEDVVTHIKAQRSVEYLDLTDYFAKADNNILLETDDALYHDVVSFVKDKDEVSISMLQRQFRIGYNRSARIITMLESEGIIMPADGGKMRRVVK